MDRRHVVGARIDAFGSERGGHLVAGQAELGRADAHREVLERRAVLLADALEADAGEVAEQASIDGRQGVAPFGFGLEEGEPLEAQQRARFGQAAVEPDEERVVGAGIAVLAAHHDALCELVVVGRDDPSLAGDQQLCGRRAEHLRQALAAHRCAVAQGAEAVGRVVDDGHAAARGQGVEGRGVGRVAKEVHWRDDGRCGGEGRLGGHGAQAPGVGVDVGKDRPQAGPYSGHRGRHEGEARQDDVGAAVAVEDEHEPGRARRHAHGVAHAEVLGEGALVVGQDGALGDRARGVSLAQPGLEVGERRQCGPQQVQVVGKGGWAPEDGGS